MNWYVEYYLDHKCVYAPEDPAPILPREGEIVYLWEETRELGVASRNCVKLRVRAVVHSLLRERTPGGSMAIESHWVIVHLCPLSVTEAQHLQGNLGIPTGYEHEELPDWIKKKMEAQE